jgi:hypothetical protein
MKLTHLGIPPSSIPLGIQAEENLFRKILQDLEKQARIQGGIQRKNCWKSSHMLKNQKKVEINPPALLDAQEIEEVIDTFTERLDPLSQNDIDA